MGFFSRKVQYSGDMTPDPNVVRQWEEWAKISGQSIRIPGGAEPTSYLRDRLKAAKREDEEIKKRAEKAKKELEAKQKKAAEKAAKAEAKKKR